MGSGFRGHGGWVGGWVQAGAMKIQTLHLNPPPCPRWQLKPPEGKWLTRNYHASFSFLPKLSLREKTQPPGFKPLNHRRGLRACSLASDIYCQCNNTQADARKKKRWSHFRWAGASGGDGFCIARSAKLIGGRRTEGHGLGSQSASVSSRSLMSVRGSSKNNCGGVERTTASAPKTILQFWRCQVRMSCLDRHFWMMDGS